MFIFTKKVESAFFMQSYRNKLFYGCTELLSPGAESDAMMAEGCLDDHDIDRRGSLLDDMDDVLTSDGGLLLDVGSGDLCDMHDPDLDESNRAIRYSHISYTQSGIYSTETRF